MSYKSKYTGAEVDERLDRVDEIPTKISDIDNDVGFITKDNANKTFGTKEDVEEITEQVGELKTKIENLESQDFAWVDVE